jgi:hypothetical protein
MGMYEKGEGMAILIGEIRETRIHHGGTEYADFQHLPWGIMLEGKNSHPTWIQGRYGHVSA